MRQFIDLVERVQFNHQIFDDALATLKANISPRGTYPGAAAQIKKCLEGLAQQYAEESHPIHVVIDPVIGGDIGFGRLAAARDQAWLMINVEAMLPVDWRGLDPDEFGGVLFKIAQTFTHEMEHYQQFCRNWQYHEANFDKPSSDMRPTASDAVRELIKSFGGAALALSALKTDLADAISKAPTVQAFIQNNDRGQQKKFLSEIYRQLVQISKQG